jgi:hypothetical protein
VALDQLLFLLPIAVITNSRVKRILINLLVIVKKLLRDFFAPIADPLYLVAEVLPDLIFARIASLDEPSHIKPTMHIYCDSSQVWDRPNDHLAKFGKMPS